VAAPEEIARVHQQRQRGIILSLIAAILGLWRRLDEDRLTESWQAGVGPSIVETVARAQLSAAAAAPDYLRDLAEAQNIMPALEVVPEAFSGIASDGRPLESLMYQPIIALKRLLAEGVDPNEAMRRATAGMTMIAATQAADAGRGAVEAGMTANKQWTKYVRVVDLPACSRCIILAGQVYPYSAGFERHPSCDCVHMAVTEDSADPPSPQDLFERMSAEEQDRRFGKAGAEAVRLGADMGQVVNARRGMQTAGGRLVTSEGTSKRGFAASRMRRGQVRLMPETIIAEAGGDRDAAIQGLRDNGFLLDPSTPRRRESAPAMESSAPPITAPEPEPEAAPAPRWHRSLDGIEDLATAVEDPRPPIARQVLTGGESAVTELLTLADGTRVVRKSGVTADVPDALDAEQAASLVARALGLRAPRVYRNAPDSIWMAYVDDAVTAEELRETDPAEWDARNRAALDLDDGSLVGLLDVLISNQDRNTGNWMLAADGRTVPIDHGHSYTVLAEDFETYLPVPDRVDEVTGLGPFADSFTSGSNPLARSDVPEVRRRLERLRPDFEHMGRGGWLDYSLQVLDKIEPEASGFGSVFPEEPS
jgi:hypothetical protein